jgi:hypothetical protein
MYGVKCIVGFVPIGYFELIFELMPISKRFTKVAVSSHRGPRRTCVRLRKGDLSYISEAAGMSTFVQSERVFTYYATSNAAECEA